MTEQANETTETVVNEGVLVDSEGKEVSVEEAAEAKKDEPELLLGKFKTADDLAKSYQELEKTLKEKGKLAPDEYELAEDIGLSQDDETYKAFQDVAKSTNMTNDQLNAVLKFAADNDLLSAPDYESEMQALGADKDKIIGNLTNFAKNKLSQDEQAVFEGLVFTADQAKLLNKIIMGTNPTNIPAKASVDVQNIENLQKELNALLSNPAIRNDNDMKQRATELAEAIAKGKK
jgi:hypothetical protein